MAFFVNLVALTWHHDRYAVHSQINGEVNWKLLEARGLVTDVSENPSYLDEMAPVSRRGFATFLPTNSAFHSDAVRSWYASLPDEVQFILVHRGEWSSGF